ncbi:hypothetical protein B23_0823 [Geobacillus thermoleovorans B23]|nr:hypothetical protein B23_0823 [Geobacillus thermoleovorans B23]
MDTFSCFWADRKRATVAKEPEAITKRMTIIDVRLKT